MTTRTLSLRQLAARLRDKRTSAETLTEDCLAAIERRDGTLNAFVTVLADQARWRARQADLELAAGIDLGPLHGIPLSVKDLIDLEDVPTTGASASTGCRPAGRDAPVVARLRAAGAVFIGKCNLHELALGTTGAESRFGPTRNPCAPGHIPGGSSSGSAVSIAAGMAMASVGTDTGGSIRIPAAACGIVGLKPTHGELSCDGVIPLAATLDHIGPLGASVDDVTRIYEVMAGRPLAEVHAPDRAPRLGALGGYFLDVIDDEVRVHVMDHLESLRRDGWGVDEIELPRASAIADVYRRTVLYEAYRVHRVRLADHPGEFSPGVRARLEAGAAISDREYLEAQDMRTVLRRDVDRALADREALVLPTLPVPAPALGVETVWLGGVAHGVRELTLRLTQLFDLTGHPAISLPLGLTSDGLPTGLQLVGTRGRTPALLHLAAAHERVIRTRRRAPWL